MPDLQRLLRVRRLADLQYDLASAIGRYMTECLVRADGAAAPELRDEWLRYAADAERTLQTMKGVCTVLWKDVTNDADGG